MDSPPIISPDKLPDPWLVDSEYLLTELARIRQLALLIPFSPDVLARVQPTNTVIDAIWRLEEQLRFLLRLRTEGQWSFGKRAEKSADMPPAVPKAGKAVFGGNSSALHA